MRVLPYILTVKIIGLSVSSTPILTILLISYCVQVAGLQPLEYMLWCGWRLHRSQDLPIQPSSSKAHRGKVCVPIFIEMSVRSCMWASTSVIWPKKTRGSDFLGTYGMLRKERLVHSILSYLNYIYLLVKWNLFVSISSCVFTATFGPISGAMVITCVYSATFTPLNHSFLLIILVECRDCISTYCRVN